MEAIQIIIELIFFVAPYVLCGIAGAYLEAKYGAKALAAAKAELAALKAKL